MQSSLNELYKNKDMNKRKESIQQLFQSIFHFIYISANYVGHFLLVVCLQMQEVLYSHLYDYPSTPVIVEKILSKEDLYHKHEKERFYKIYDSLEIDSKIMNQNTDAEFYDIELYKKAVEHDHGDFEKKWMRRILYESTPRGNIIMHYDVYKKGFAFYCDHNGMPYSILNTVAKKYVRVFVCRDLFIDDSELPDYSSPLIKINESEDKIEKEKKTENINGGINRDILKNAPFAKLKRYNMEEKSTSTDVAKKVNINKFIYKGKTVNFSIIQRTLRAKPSIVFTNSSFTAMFEKEHESQQNVMSYSSYKKMTQKPDVEEKVDPESEDETLLKIET
jgi:hypothetical protein